MKFELDDYNRNIPDNLLIEDLVLVAKKLDKDSVTHEEYNLNGKYSSTTYLRRFGSWFNAFENRFGSWRKALEKFVAYINNEENISSEKATQKLEVGPSTKHKTKRNINWREIILNAKNVADRQRPTQQ